MNKNKEIEMSFEKHFKRVYPGRELTPDVHDSNIRFFYDYGYGDGERDGEYPVMKKFRELVEKALKEKTAWGRNDIAKLLDRCAIEALMT